MELRESLKEGFAYDRWANERWLAIAPDFPDWPQAETIVSHIARAQHIWLSRCLSDEDVAPLDPNVETALTVLHRAWIELLDFCDPTAFVSYTTMDGTSSFSTIEQIARHVVNHGTYHRGQLRGLAAALGFEGFPETDLIRYYRELAAS